MSSIGNLVDSAIDEIEPYFLKSNADDLVLDNNSTLLDKDWLSKTFMVTDSDLEDPDIFNRYYSTAELKFTDTSLGGNIGINSRPQFTRTADIRVKGRNTSRNRVSVNSHSGNYGMGRFYSEFIDDPKQKVFFEFGVPEFNSLVSFFSRSIDYATSVVANTGRSPIAYEAGKVFGAASMFVAFPLASLAVYGIKFVSSMLSNNDVFSYYYMKPVMHNYWNTVNTIVSSFATELGILIPEFTDSGESAERIGIPFKINQEDLDYMRKLLPGLITDENYIDVFAIANRAQTIANKHILLEKKAFDEGRLSNVDFEGYIKTPLTKNENRSPGEGFSNTLNEIFSLNKTPSIYDTGDEINSYSDYLNKIMEKDKGAYSKKTLEDKIEEDSNSPLEYTAPNKDTYENPDGTVNKLNNENDSSWFESVTANIDASVRGGGANAIFVVDYLGSVNESFSNQITDIPAGDMIKSVANKSKSVKFSLAGGNLAMNMDNVLGYAKDLAMGTLDGLTFGLSNVIPSLLGGGYIDLPKMWDDSSVTLPSHNFSMTLVPPYGHTISRLQNVYIPLSMIMAGALPLSIGNAGYTSPFLCSMYIKGIQRIKMGMITSLSITRGTTNLGFDRNNSALGYEVTFTVTDFSNMMTAPVNSGIFGGFKMAFDDSSVFSNYISTLTARDLMVTKYSIPKAKIRLSRALFNKEALLSPAFFGMRAGRTLDGVLGSVTSNMHLGLMDNNNRF